MTETRQRKGKEKSTKTENGSTPDVQDLQPTGKKLLKSRIARLKEQQSKGISHFLLTVCKVIIAVMIIPPFLNYAALQREESMLKPEGELYDIGWGQKLFLSCKGKGAPTVILDAPTGMNSDVWDLVLDKVAKHTRVGPLYFKTPRKCEVFGVCCECSEKQVFYLADEGIAPGKGANTVISYIHHFLATYGFGETEALFHFDNCSSQNKNNAVLWYAIWRVMTGLHKKITYSMTVAGHTKFSPDMHFGIWKSRWRRVDAETVQVCSYDRAGLGYSERPRMNSSEVDGSESKSNYRNRWTPFTAERMVEDLHQLVSRSSDQPKPYLLVGAELGALVAQFYTRMFESEVVGLILINPLSDDLFELDKGVWTMNWFGHVTPAYQTLQLSAALGVTRISIMLGLLQHPMHMATGIADDTEKRQKFLMCHPRHLSTVVDEHHFINETFSQFRTASMIKGIPSNISITVITGNYYDEQMPGPLNKAWAKSVQNLITNKYPHSQHIVVNGADRHVMYQHPEAIVEPIRKAVKAWRSKNSNTFDR